MGHTMNSTRPHCGREVHEAYTVEAGVKLALSIEKCCPFEQRKLSNVPN